MASENNEIKQIYHRPHDNWICGLGEQGKRCSHGPNPSGTCPHANCQPARRTQWWKNHVRALIAMVGVCAIAIIMASPWHREFVAPGPLSKSHAQILKSDGASNRCATCHPAGALPAVSWLVSFNPKVGPHGTQKQLCLECHQSKMPNLVRSNPHDLERDALDFLTKSKRQDPIGRKLVGSNIHWQSQDFTCSDCHREHQGALLPLDALSSEKCQVCHVQQFGSFASDHPEFKKYPYDRQRALSFDHNSHRDKHFAKKDHSFDCRTCHVDAGNASAVGDVFRSVSFASACASCHEESIRSSLADGIPVLQLPSIDKKGMSKFGVNIGWPDEAGQIMDGSIPPIMQLLLYSDEVGRKALGGIPSGDLSKLKLSNPNDRQVVQDLMLATKRLMQEIAEDGQEALQKRIAYWNTEGSDDSKTLVSFNPNPAPNALLSSKIDLNTTRNKKLLQGLPPDVFRSAYRQWFEASPAISKTAKATLASPKPASGDPSDLLSENNDPLNGSKEAPSADSMNGGTWKPKSLKPIKHLSAGGWMIDERRMAIVYVPTGHADPWLAAWTELADLAQVNTRQANEDAAKNWSGGADLPSGFVPGSELLTKQYLGNCIQCHQIRRDVTSSHLVRHLDSPWNTERRSTTLRQFTKFDHEPHLLLPKLADCQSCHRLTSLLTQASPKKTEEVNDEVRAASYVELNKDDHSKSNNSLSPVGDMKSEFLPMTKSNCAECHRSQAASQSCTQCHNYHLN